MWLILLAVVHADVIPIEPPEICVPQLCGEQEGASCVVDGDDRSACDALVARGFTLACQTPGNAEQTLWTEVYCLYPATPPEPMPPKRRCATTPLGAGFAGLGLLLFGLAFRLRSRSIRESGAD